MKRTLILLTAVALVGGLLSAGSVRAQEAPPTTVPEQVLVEDPVGDGNYLNGQGAATGQGDHTTPADISSVGDIMKVWLSNTADTISAHVLTEAAPPASAPLFFRVRVNPGADTNCLWFQATVGDANGLTGEPSGNLRDTCGDLGTMTEGVTVQLEETGEGNGITTITVPRSLHPFFTDGAVLTMTAAESRNVIPHPQGGSAAVVPQIDDTLEGIDYTIGGGGTVEEPPVVDPPPVDPPVKKGCKKGKGKKKGCKPTCPTFTPAEAGAEAPVTVVTDKATEEAPIEIPVTTESGLPVAASHVFHNLQVDSKAKDAGLYVRYEFETYEDLDLYLYNADGSTAAQAAGFNPFPFIPNNPVFFTDGTGTGGHSEMGAEQVDGVLTPDCGGYTADLAQYLAEGGDRVLKVWLGPATWDPVAQAPIEQEGEGD